MTARNNMRQHQKIWVEHHGQIPQGKHIHHIDGNHLNNNIDNLVCVGREMHRAFHEDRYKNLGLKKDAFAVKLLGGDNYLTTWKHSEESRKKMSEAKKGIGHSEEARKKISDYHKGRKKSEKHRENISKGRKGIKFSEEHKRNLSKALKGRKQSEEHKMNIAKGKAKAYKNLESAKAKK